MRKTLAPEVEATRELDSSKHGDGCMGVFRMVHPTTGRALLVIVSDGRDWGEECPPMPPAVVATYPKHIQERHRQLFKDGPVKYDPPAWEHVSVSSKFGCPTWEEMCWVKDQFWEPEECVIQFHPPHSQYVNVHNHCLHLWRCVEGETRLPPNACV